ncbi:hypothetical protein [Streptomyces sp. NPDC126933]|uniref:hypothetical protein n=1 Tax=unclassified Streptomyces TaxID=2593676 RepID=UPI003657B7F8
MLHADPNRPYEAHYEDGTVRPVVALGVDPAIPETIYMLVLNESDGSVVAPSVIKGLRGVRPVGA